MRRPSGCCEDLRVVVDLPFEPAMELVGVFVGALSGALAGVRKRFDIFGIVVMAWAAGLGGGIMRDVVIGSIPPVGIARWEYIATACAAGVLMFFLHPRMGRARRVVLVLDSGALALFSVVGTLKALELGVGATASVCAGVLTGVGGGVLRDLLSAEVPVVLHHRQLYAIPSLLGATVTAILWQTGTLTVVTSSAVVVGVFALRLLALRYRLQAPGPWSGGLGAGQRGRAGWRGRGRQGARATGARGGARRGRAGHGRGRSAPGTVSGKIDE